MAENRQSRRDFLNQLALLLASGGYLSSDLSAFAAAPKAAPYTLAPWKGDDFALGHKMRGGEYPKFPLDSERTVDFVIVGGGMSGLSAAYYLKDQDFLLLEQYAELGGQSRGGSNNGLAYSYGAAYISEPQGLIGDMVSDLNLHPARVGPQKNAWREGKSWVSGVYGDKGLYADFKKMEADSKTIFAKTLNETKLVPLDDTELSRLDSITFASTLKGYSPAFLALMESMMKSNNCGGINTISALAGYLNARDLWEPSYVFEGGNPALARALAAKVSSDKSRCQTNAFVWSIEIKEDGASVVYGTKDNVIHRVNCKHVIVSSPPLVSARIMHGIDDALKAKLLSFKYGSYLVANLIMRKKVFNGAYDNWVTSPYTFGDVTVAETPYMVNKSYKPSMGSVLTVYQPYEPRSPGRALLFVGDRQAFASSIIKQMSELIGSPLEKELQSVVLSRWGHAMAVVTPNHYSKISKIAAATNSGAFSLAHCSLQGLACAESAVLAAKLAADRALAVKKKAQGIYSLPGSIIKS